MLKGKTKASSDEQEQHSSRSVSSVIDSTETSEGGGFVVHRPFPTNALLDFDPFLLLDEMGPKDWKPGEAKGAPDHPHRGFETVTYMLDGKFEHKDSRGNSGKLGPGDVQWMTAGAGVVHSEMPEKEFLRTGGKLHAFQLWVNLPQRDKMIKPRYQDFLSAKIPVAQAEDGTIRVKVIAGEALGAHAVIQTRTPIIYLHFALKPGAEVIQPVPSAYNTFAYIISGEGLFGTSKQPAKRGQMVIFAKDGKGIAISTPEKSKSPLDVLLIGGLPLDEPIARYGPFVMNTKAEIYRAIDDYQNGRMGVINGS